jgi:hypothetical protein
MREPSPEEMHQSESSNNAIDVHMEHKEVVEERVRIYPVIAEIALDWKDLLGRLTHCDYATIQSSSNFSRFRPHILCFLDHQLDLIHQGRHLQ